MKKILLCSLALVVTLSTALFVGCSDPSDSLSKALTNTANINSYESSSSVQVKIDGNEQAKAMNLSEFGFDMKNKVVGEKNKKQDSSSDISIKYGGMSINTSLFSEGTYENNKLNSKITVTIPPILIDLLNSAAQNQLPGEKSILNSNTKYLVMDSKELEQAFGKGIDQEQYKKVSEQMQGLTGSIEKAVDKYVSTIGKESVMKKGNKEISINGSKIKATVYEIKVTDKQLKSFMKGYVNNLENDKELQNFLKTVIPSTEKDLDFKEMITNFNKEFDKLPQIIGENGLNVSFAVKDDYIIQETFETDIIASDFASSSTTTTPLAKIHIKCSTDIFNINSKNIKIDFPKADKTNSINLVDLMNAK
jgi:uncharacterized lipoprotein YajG